MTRPVLPTHRPIVSTPVVKLTFSSIVSFLTKALAFLAASAQPPSPEIGLESASLVVVGAGLAAGALLGVELAVLLSSLDLVDTAELSGTEDTAEDAAEGAAELLAELETDDFEELAEDALDEAALEAPTDVAIEEEEILLLLIGMLVVPLAV